MFITNGKMLITSKNYKNNSYNFAFGFNFIARKNFELSVLRIVLEKTNLLKNTQNLRKESSKKSSKAKRYSHVVLVDLTCLSGVHMNIFAGEMMLQLHVPNTKYLYFRYVKKSLNKHQSIKQREAQKYERCSAVPVSRRRSGADGSCFG